MKSASPFAPWLCLIALVGCKPPAVTPTPEPTTTSSSGSGCDSSDPDHICLAIKYVVYKDSSEVPVITRSQADANINTANSVWKACNIEFQIDQYQNVAPLNFGLNFNPANLSEMTDIRARFEDNLGLLITTTGLWNRTGTLGNTAANSWTAYPTSAARGVVIEKSYGAYGPMIAHELGHTLNLMHENDSANAMNPVIYATSNKLTALQCSSARSAALQYWSGMRL